MTTEKAIAYKDLKEPVKAGKKNSDIEGLYNLKAVGFSVKDLKHYLITFTFAFAFFKFIVVPVYIPTESMDPTIKAGTLGFALRLPYLLSAGDVQHGDIVIFEDETGKNICKRVIAVGGDELTIKDGEVYLNCQPLNESYLKESNSTVCFKENYDVPSGTVFLMGDNRCNSKDSRLWCSPFVSMSEIKAKWLFGI